MTDIQKEFYANNNNQVGYCESTICKDCGALIDSTR